MTTTLLQYPIIKLTAFLIIGIVIAPHLQCQDTMAIYVTVVFVILLGVYKRLLRHKVNYNPYYAVLTYLCMIGIGINAFNITKETLKSQHYTHLNLGIAPIHITFKIKERVKPDAYNNNYTVNVLSINNTTASGQLLIHITQDSTKQNLPVDAVLSTTARLLPIPKPLNPYQFDYQKYLKSKQIYHQIYLNTDSIFLRSKAVTSIYGYADRLRMKINKNLRISGFSDLHLSLINAMLLGQRQSIDKTTYNNYIATGTIHILAVSGLHVGILLALLTLLFKPLLHLKYGRIIRPTLIVILLWGFAVIAGLSPSVTRAVSMFSIISIAMHLKRATSIYNTLAISIFLILLVKPRFLFDPGFQMSYLAVLGIVSIQPQLYKLWKPKRFITNKLWQISTVTVAAQCGVLPISLLYFHQFPGVFFISNLVVIPFLGMILGLGILVIALTLIHAIPEFLVHIYSYMIDGLNGFISWIAQFEYFLFKDIPFTWLQALMSYTIILTLFQVYKFKTFKWSVITLISVIGFQCITLYQRIQKSSNALIIFNKPKHSLIGLKYNSRLTLYHDLDTISPHKSPIIKNFIVGAIISDLQTNHLQMLYHLNTNTLLTVDSLGVYNNLSFTPNYVLLSHSPKVNLNRLIDTLQPQKIIADASNFKSYVQRWKITCTERKIPFHYTNEKGAYILSK